MADFEKKVAELFLEIPEVKLPHAAVASCVVVDKLAFCTQALPFAAGKISFRGRLGMEVSLDRGQLAGRHALFVSLGALRETLGSLNKIKQIVQLSWAIACGGDFTEFDRVVDPASALLQELFGAAGKHARHVIGVNQLPQQACLSLSLVASVK
ncbi:MAG: RidA family protein [Deltaproteobacteria bacterium]|nr:RidA family protein [Deltaproteobacteria bacterium]